MRHDVYSMLSFSTTKSKRKKKNTNILCKKEFYADVWIIFRDEFGGPWAQGP